MMGQMTKIGKPITHLSFSRLTELAHSPLVLKQYIEGVRIETEAMKEGSLLDCLLFEPETFEKRFYEIPKIDRRTKEGRAAFEAAMERKGERLLVTDEQVSDAKFLNECIRSNSTIAFHGLLNPDFFSFQVKTEFAYGGFLHKGIKDADGTRRDGQRAIWDLKRMGSRSGEQLVRSQIRNNMYDLQAAIYCHPFDSTGESVKYYVVAVDNEGFVTPFEITRDSRDKARILWNKLIRAAHECNLNGLDMGCEFWAEQDGFFFY